MHTGVPVTDKSEQRPAHTGVPDVVAMGCRLNGYEADQMRALAQRAGLTEAVILNSCAVTHEAVRQTRQNIRKLSQQKDGRRVIVTGCAAQLDPQAFADMPEVDCVLGNEDKLDPAAWQSIAQDNIPLIHSDIMKARGIKKPDWPAAVQQSRARAYLQIQTGCDHRCTFCIIPLARGNARSVPADRIIAEIRVLVASGYQEVVLTGVDITSYGDDLEEPVTLGHIVDRILTEIPDLNRLRLSSIDGAEIDEHLFGLVTTQRRIAPHLHLSLQSGDDMILKRMKRRHNRAGAIEFCRQIREQRPEIALGADIIAGFPTETDEMFNRSVSLIEACNLSYVHVFPFSARAGTPAARMPQISRAVVKARAKRLREAAAAALGRHFRSKIGTLGDALIESCGADGLLKARLPDFTQVKIRADAAIGPGGTRADECLPGTIQSVNITHMDMHVLYGTLQVRG